MSFGDPASWLLKTGWISSQWVINRLTVMYQIDCCLWVFLFKVLLFSYSGGAGWWYSSIASYFPSRLQPLHSRIVNSHVKAGQTQIFKISTLRRNNWISLYIHMMYRPGYVNHLHSDWYVWKMWKHMYRNAISKLFVSFSFMFQDYSAMS